MQLKAKDFWLPNTSYSESSRCTSLIVYDSKFYLCTTAHLSGQEFDESKFILVGGAGGGSGSGVVPKFEWDISANTVEGDLVESDAKFSIGLDAIVNNDGIVFRNDPLTEYLNDELPSWGGATSDNIVNDFTTTKWFQINLTNNIEFYKFAITSTTPQAYLSEIDMLLNDESAIATMTCCGAFIQKFNQDINLKFFYTVIGEPITISTTFELNNPSIDIGFNFTDNVVICDDGGDLTNFEIPDGLLDGMGISFVQTTSYYSPFLVRGIFGIEFPTSLEKEHIKERIPSYVYSLPEGTVDGDALLLTTNGVYNGIKLYSGDIVVVYDELSKIVVIYSEVNEEIDSLKSQITDINASSITDSERVIIRGVIDQLDGIRPNEPINYYTMIENDSLFYYKDGDWTDITDNLSTNQSFNYANFNVRLEYNSNMVSVEKPIYKFSENPLQEGDVLSDFLSNTTAWKLSSSTVAVNTPTDFIVYNSGGLVIEFNQYNDCHVYLGISEGNLAIQNYTIGLFMNASKGITGLSTVSIEPKRVLIENPLPVDVKILTPDDTYIPQSPFVDSNFIIPAKQSITIGIRDLYNSALSLEEIRLQLLYIDGNYSKHQLISSNADLAKPNVTNFYVESNTVTEIIPSVYSLYDGLKYTIRNMAGNDVTLDFNIYEKKTDTLHARNFTITTLTTVEVIFMDNSLYILGAA